MSKFDITIQGQDRVLDYTPSSKRRNQATNCVLKSKDTVTQKELKEISMFSGLNIEPAALEVGAALVGSAALILGAKKIRPCKKTFPCI